MSLKDWTSREIDVASAGFCGVRGAVECCVLEAVDCGDCVLLERIRINSVCTIWILAEDGDSRSGKHREMV
jgi:hypothetical protein